MQSRPQEEKSAGQGRSPPLLLMPADVSPWLVLSLVEIVKDSGGKVKTQMLAGGLEADLTVFPAVLEAGEMLGLVQTVKDEVCLTELGFSFLKTPKNKVRMLKDTIVTFEPFRTALQRTSKGAPVTSSQVARVLRETGIRWHYQPETNDGIINMLLINWMIPAGLFRYDKSGRFHKIA